MTGSLRHVSCAGILAGDCVDSALLWFVSPSLTELGLCYWPVPTLTVEAGSVGGGMLS